MHSLIDKMWYGTHPLSLLLRPFSWVYRLVIGFRRWFLIHFAQHELSVPLIVVGNLTVGGVGKTPLVIEIAKKAQEKGLKVGIVSRGYGSRARTYPYEVQLNDSAFHVGDEPLLIAEKTQCPVIISPKRIEAVHYLIKHHQPDVIISDDGLQHYQMSRAIEIAVLDGTRGLGNKQCLPAGPLREPQSRLNQVDFVVVNEGNWPGAFMMKLMPEAMIQLSSGQKINPDFFKEEVAAVAAIGNPKRFYSTLQDLGIKFRAYGFPDHYVYQPGDLRFKEPKVIMTEKDAVKCRGFSTEGMYYLSVHARLGDAFWDALWSHQRLKGLVSA